MSVLNPEMARPHPTPLPAPDPAPRGVEPGQLFIIHDVSYASYLAMSDAIMDRSRIRFTVLRGTLEIMSTSGRHEDFKDRLGRLLGVVFEELDLPAIGGGSQTLRSDELERGFEPDQCFWTTNWERVREAYFLWHPDKQPPPDLVVEIEVSRVAVNKLELSASYRAPEVWRFDGTALRVHVLQAGGGYLESTTSPTFPRMPVAELSRFLAPGADREIGAFCRAVRAWVRQWPPTAG